MGCIGPFFLCFCFFFLCVFFLFFLNKLILCGHRVGKGLDLFPPLQNLQVSGGKKKKKAIGLVSGFFTKNS